MNLYVLEDTIIAVSSPSSEQKVLVRISGMKTFEHVNKYFTPTLKTDKFEIVHGKLSIRNDFSIDATAYAFAAGKSYTNEELVELHLWSNNALTEAVLKQFYDCGIRHAGPGEFTARAYMNGKLDLSAAEAVNEVVISSNRLQLAAAQKLLCGRLTQTTSEAADEMIQILSLIEAGMDFSEEDIEFISSNQAVERLSGAKEKLEHLLSGSISFEAMLDLPSVGISGAPNAGKSSLLNALLGHERSIVSSQRKTTRDVLTGIIEFEHNRCVVFDCAGLIANPVDKIDVLAQQGAVDALANSVVTVFCVDITKHDTSEDTLIRELINCDVVVPIATKADLIEESAIQDRLEALLKNFGFKFTPISSLDSKSIEKLSCLIDASLTKQITGGAGASEASVTLTARHKQSVQLASDNISNAIKELKNGNDEVASMMIRAAYQSLCELEREHVDEKLLDNIFSEFCIGK